MNDHFADQRVQVRSGIRPCASSADACGKTIIVGEHAVVYGTRAVAIPLKQMRMQANLVPLNKTGTLDISLKIGGKEVTQHVQAVVFDGFRALGCEPFSLTIKGQSSLPIGAGLGSSATLCLVILRLLSRACDISLDDATFARLGNELEKRFHGNPSGLDTATVAYEKPIVFRKAQPIESLPVRAPKAAKNWPFALIDSNVRASTMAMIHLAAPFFQGSEGERRLAKFESLASQVIHGLGGGDLEVVADAMSETGSLLMESGVVTSTLAEIIDEAKSVGALSAKSTGAGGGGAVLVLLKPEQAESQMAQLRTKFGPGRVFSAFL